jgi:hypothetical protein
VSFRSLATAGSRAAVDGGVSGTGSGGGASGSLAADAAGEPQSAIRRSRARYAAAGWAGRRMASCGGRTNARQPAVAQVVSYFCRAAEQEPRGGIWRRPILARFAAAS